MAIGYNLFKVNDSYTLEVLADCTVNFYYKDNGTDIFLDTWELLAEEAINLSINKDGDYKVVLIDPATSEETLIEFRINYYLERSIVSDIYYILTKDDYTSGCKVYKETCISREERKILKSRDIFVKLFTYQFKYLPLGSYNTNLAFNNYMTKAADAYKCNIQTKINTILEDECNGNSTSSNTLFKLFIAIYWAGLYFIAKSNAQTEEEKRYVESKYYYSYINAALCDFSITLKDLENIYNNNA